MTRADGHVVYRATRQPRGQGPQLHQAAASKSVRNHVELRNNTISLPALSRLLRLLLVLKQRWGSFVDAHGCSTCGAVMGNDVQRTTYSLLITPKALFAPPPAPLLNQILRTRGPVLFAGV